MSALRWTCTFVFFLVSILESSSQTCCSGGVPLTNNIGGLPMADEGTLQFSLSADANILKTLKEGNATLDDDSRERTTLSVILKTSYSFTDNFFVESLISWVQQERKVKQIGGYSDFEQTQGIGDWVVIANQKYLSKNGWDLIMGAGPKFPTGKANLSDESGLTLNADMQPGSGAWDGVFIHRIIRTDQRRKTLSYFLNFTYRMTGKNRDYLGGQTYQFGNEWQILAGVSDQVALRRSLLSFGLNFRYRVAGQDRFNEEILPNTGGDFIYVMPAIGWYARPNLVLFINSEVPAYTRVEGTQLAPSFRINGGVYITLSTK